MFSEVRKRAKKAGLPPGTARYTGKKRTSPPLITVTTYSPHDFHEIKGTKLSECFPITEAGIKWVNVEGLDDVDLIKQIGQNFEIHPLTIEDILNVEQRSKVEEFESYIFITLKVLHWSEKNSTFQIKQLSLVMGKDFVLSFQELKTSLFEPIRTRLRSTPSQRLREQGSDYLTYRLIDAVVDEYFVVLEKLGDQLEHAEELILKFPTPNNARTIYRMKRQMLLLRKAIWPMREAIGHLMHVEINLITKFTSLYMRDLYDHTVQAIDTLETFREMISNMLDMYLSSLTNRMNEIMKTLTIIATIFIPITAIASIYGMNFEYMPELHWRYGYPFVVSIMFIIAMLLLLYFYRKKWI